MTLADALADWNWWDGAQFELGQAMGHFAGCEFLEVKYVFWADNPLGNGLHDILLMLVEAGVLERREEPDEQFRWRAGAAVDLDEYRRFLPPDQTG